MKNSKHFILPLLITAVTFIAADVAVGFLVFKPDTPFPGIRSYILTGGTIPRYLPQPYLNYINHPQRLMDDESSQINKWGLRHSVDIKLPKPDSTWRILFLGGSTTFGEINKTEKVFPALIEKALNDSIGVINPQYNSVECINAGMGAATSAEILTHYLFKLKYLNPDVVVIHAGINDAFTTANIPGYVYQPDYHTSKKIMEPLHSVTPMMKLLANSKIVSYFIINRYYRKQLNSSFTANDFFSYHQDNLWFEHANERKFSKEANGFYNNISELVKNLLPRKNVVLVTEVVDPLKMPQQLKEMLVEGIEVNKKFMMDISAENNLPICVLSNNEFTTDLFGENDGIHVNEEGEKLKAKKILPVLKQIIGK